MAKITISGTEEKKPVVTTPSTSGGTSSGTSGKTSSGTSAGAEDNVIRPGQSSKKDIVYGSDEYMSYLLNSSNKNKTQTITPEQIVFSDNAAANEAQAKAETSLADLKNKYSQNLREQYDYSAEKLKNERDEALRENWILQQQAEAALPEQMAAAGINGGASETSLAALRARYQGDRNNIRGNYMNNLGDLTQQNQAERAEAERSYNERWADYLLSLAQMGKQHQYNKELKYLEELYAGND